jgi:uncharacterized protein
MQQIHPSSRRQLLKPSALVSLVVSPSGKTLFVNIQEKGDRLAITGDWDRLQHFS